jgi:predicted TIM-barrel fold metal-dependent hydrolase
MQEIGKLNLGPEVEDLFLRDNATRVYGLASSTSRPPQPTQGKS